jgi:hypothetical protein
MFDFWRIACRRLLKSHLLAALVWTISNQAVGAVLQQIVYVRHVLQSSLFQDMIASMKDALTRDWTNEALDNRFHPKFHYVKRRFIVTLKYRYMHGVLNIDEIKKTNCTVLLYFTRRTF